MSDEKPTSEVSALIVPAEHGALHGCLTLVPESTGLVVLIHAALALNAEDGSLASRLRDAGFSTLSVDLIAHEEVHFPDLRNNVPQLAKRLLLFLTQIRHRMLMGEIATQSLALYAVNDTSPVAVRIASQRDHDIAALVCRGGLIDLAGILYLRSLATPILILHTPSETHHTEGNRRALRETHCPHELKIIPETGTQTAALSGTEIALRETVAWFVKHLGGHPGQVA